jgi:rhodanese-related sulfurtransferase
VADLQRIGLDNTAGFFTSDQIALWASQPGHQLSTIPQTSVADVTDDVLASHVTFIDVRSAAEFAAGHLPGARNIPLTNLLDHLAEIPTDQPVLRHCCNGFRSSIAAGLLASRGWGNVMNLQGGYSAWCLVPNRSITV